MSNAVTWKNDTELFELMKEKLFTALVGDILDIKGYWTQFLPPNIKTIRDDMVILGRAMTVLEADYHGNELYGHNELSKKHFGMMFQALDDLKENEIYVVTGSSPSYALWGGLMSTRAMKCGSTGAVLDGFHRDSNEIERLNFPLASIGGYAQDQNVRGKVIDFRVPIKIGDVTINDGDIIFGDRDGVVVVPKSVEVEVLQAAFEKAEAENEVMKALQQGMSCTEAYEKFGVM